MVSVSVFASRLILEDVVVSCNVTPINWRQFNQIGMLMKQPCAQEMQNNMHKKSETVNNNTMTVNVEDSNLMVQNQSNPCSPKATKGLIDSTQ